MPVVGKVERDRELVDPGVAQLLVLINVHRRTVADQDHPGQTARVRHCARDIINVAPRQRLAAGDVGHYGTQLAADRRVVLGLEPCLALERPAPVAVPAIRRAVMRDLEGDRNGTLLEFVAQPAIQHLEGQLAANVH